MCLISLLSGGINKIFHAYTTKEQICLLYVSADIFWMFNSWYHSHSKINPASLTHCILVDSSTVICCMSPFVILEVSGLFCPFDSIFDGKSC